MRGSNWSLQISGPQIAMLFHSLIFSVISLFNRNNFFYPSLKYEKNRFFFSRLLELDQESCHNTERVIIVQLENALRLIRIKRKQLATNCF